jgi:hypothetical protein
MRFTHARPVSYQAASENMIGKTCRFWQRLRA